ncbi:MAG: hypothetical protein NTX67_00695 [Burkholderiales bacterium]|nr:hypothetical protein [Burkholderiales bacterium]
MSLHSIRVSLLALASAMILLACGGSSSSAPPPPEGGITVVAGESQITLSWKETPGVEYWAFSAPDNPTLSLSNWLASTGSSYRLNVTSPFVVSGLNNGTPYSFFITGRINKGPGSDATPTVTATPRLAGVEWATGANVNTGNQTGLSFGSYIDAATNTIQYAYLAVGNGGRMFKAATIDKWTAITPALTTHLNSATFAFAKFMAAGDAGQIIYSSDTQTWTKATSGTTQNLNAIETNGILAVAVGNNGTIITSKDGIAWTAATTVPTTAHLYGVTATVSGTWIAVGASGSILTSSDGAIWTAQTSNSLIDLKAAGSLASIVNNTTVYTYVVVGATGTVLSSTDAITWTPRTANTLVNLNHLSSGNQLVAVGANGTILTSIDGIAWKPQVSKTNTELRTILRAENQLIVVDSLGNIFSSK